MKKTHYALVDVANESNSSDEWSDPICNIESDFPILTNKLEYVTCKKCIKIFNDWLENHSHKINT